MLVGSIQCLESLFMLVGSSASDYWHLLLGCWTDQSYFIPFAFQIGTSSGIFALFASHPVPVFFYETWMGFAVVATAC
jgi:hypothetical protein